MTGHIAINGLTEFNHWLRDKKIATFRNLVSQLNNFIFEILVALIPCNQRKKKNSLNYCDSVFPIERHTHGVQ